MNNDGWEVQKKIEITNIASKKPAYIREILYMKGKT